MPSPILRVLMLLLAVLGSAHADLLDQHWFELRTGHFNAYSCGSTQEVAKVAARLEQFHDAYSALAGAQAVVSPPIIVMAFPSHREMEPFLPVYRGKPANLAAFFSRGVDENLIVLSLSETGNDTLESVFHEYTHLLLRRNDRFWPLWIKEGMAEIYSTFETTPDQGIRIGGPLPHHMRLLESKTWMPLTELFEVTHGSSAYNERERQGVFYSESWLLTHYLMLGDNPVLKSRFGQVTSLLRQGQAPVQAFTNALRVSLSALTAELHRYLERGKIEALKLNLSASVFGGRSIALRRLTPPEICFRLGNELLRVNRLDSAEEWFRRGVERDDRSPWPYDGLGRLEAEREQHAQAVVNFERALQKESPSYLAHYGYAREKFALTAREANTYSRVPESIAEPIRAELKKSLVLMPSFSAAHHLLGFFELVQGDDLAEAEKQLQIAVQLEPDNEGWQMAVAQAQIHRREVASARRTLEALVLPYVDSSIRERAARMLKDLPGN